MSRCILLLWFGSLLLSGWAWAGDPVATCALVYEGAGSARDTPLFALLETEMSRSGHFAMVERAAIEEVFRERALVSVLSASDSEGLARRRALGALLKARILVACGPLRGEKGDRQVWALHVADTQTGLRIAQRRFAVGDSEAEQVARGMAEWVGAQASRLATGVRAVVCVPPFFSDDLLRRYDAMQQGCATVVAERIASTPGVFVVETEQSVALAEEAMRTGDAQVNRSLQAFFIRGRYRNQMVGDVRTTVSVAVEISKSERLVYGPVRSVCGPSLLEAFLSRFASEAAERIAPGAAPPASSRPALAGDAAALRKRVREFMQVGDWLHALNLVEAAWVSNPESYDVHLDALRCVAGLLNDRGWRSLPPSRFPDYVENALRVARLGNRHLELFFFSSERPWLRRNWPASPECDVVFKTFWPAGEALWRDQWVRGETRSQVCAFGREKRDILLEWIRLAVATPGSRRHLVTSLALHADNAYVPFETGPDEYLAWRLEAMRAWHRAGVSDERLAEVLPFDAIVRFASTSIAGTWIGQNKTRFVPEFLDQMTDIGPVEAVASYGVHLNLEARKPPGARRIELVTEALASVERLAHTPFTENSIYPNKVREVVYQSSRCLRNTETPPEEKAALLKRMIHMVADASLDKITSPADDREALLRAIKRLSLSEELARAIREEMRVVGFLTEVGPTTASAARKPTAPQMTRMRRPPKKEVVSPDQLEIQTRKVLDLPYDLASWGPAGEGCDVLVGPQRVLAMHKKDSLREIYRATPGDRTLGPAVFDGARLWVPAYGRVIVMDTSGHVAAVFGESDGVPQGKVLVSSMSAGRVCAVGATPRIWAGVLSLNATGEKSVRLFLEGRQVSGKFWDPASVGAPLRLVSLSDSAKPLSLETVVFRRAPDYGDRADFFLVLPWQGKSEAGFLVRENLAMRRPVVHRGDLYGLGWSRGLWRMRAGSRQVQEIGSPQGWRDGKAHGLLSPVLAEVRGKLVGFHWTPGVEWRWEPGAFLVDVTKGRLIEIRGEAAPMWSDWSDPRPAWFARSSHYDAVQISPTPSSGVTCYEIRMKVPDALLDAPDDSPLLVGRRVIPLAKPKR